MRTAPAGKPEGWVIPYLPGSIVIQPPHEVRERVNRLRRKYDPVSAWRIPPHITVTQPFRAEPGAAELALIGRVLMDHEPLTLRFGPLRNFLPYPCIWFEVQPAEAVLALRQDLHRTGLFNTDLPYTDGFVPHMSVTDGTPDAESTERLFRRMANRVRGGEFRVDELVYTRPDWQFRFLPVKAFRLGRP